MKFSCVAIVLSAALALAGVAGAKADSIDYLLDVGNNPGLNPTNAGPYGDVLVSLTSSTTATITFTALPGFLFQSRGAVGVNVNSSSWTLSGLGGTKLTGFSSVVGDLSSRGAGNEDGWGSFNQTIKNFDGYQHAWQQITFILTDTSGTWASAASVLKDNKRDNEFAAHVGICDQNPCSSDGGNRITGFATGDDRTVPVPGPIFGGGLPGLVAACAGFVAFARRRRQQFA